MRKIAVLVLTLLAGQGAAHAQTIVPKLDEAGRKGDVVRNAREKALAQFDTADANKDGKLSKEEVAGHFRYMADNFGKHDADKDGFLSWEEFVGHNRWPK